MLDPPPALGYSAHEPGSAHMELGLHAGFMWAYVKGESASVL
jgi:hypothetical protein